MDFSDIDEDFEHYKKRTVVKNTYKANARLPPQPNREKKSNNSTLSNTRRF